jgi:hypothetical protein
LYEGLYTDQPPTEAQKKSKDELVAYARRVLAKAEADSEKLAKDPLDDKEMQDHIENQLLADQNEEEEFMAALHAETPDDTEVDYLGDEQDGREERGRGRGTRRWSEVAG